jgi:mannose-6-phosphate isomerase
MNGILPLKGSIKHYDWGGFNLIPSLLLIDNSAAKPFAEYWLGTHPMGPSTVETEKGEISLEEVTGSLPFLLKVLDVREMLSIQVHPTREAAQLEFEKENAKGIPLDSPTRNYKDGNHKPELMVALDDFWLLHGFKSPEELVYTLLNVVELRELLPIFNQSGYPGLYKHLMEMPQDEVNRILKPLINNIAAIEPDVQPDKYDEDYWAAKAANKFAVDGNMDRGIFSIYLFNIVHLKKGEGIFQDAGVPHAYLEGPNVEVMANSDNVLRGGLTTKHIDVPELLKHIRCKPIYPRILEGQAIGQYERAYIAPVNDFTLSAFELNKDESTSFTPSNPTAFVLTEGYAVLHDGSRQVELQPGHAAAIALPGTQVSIRASLKSTVFKAFGSVHRGE